MSNTGANIFQYGKGYNAERLLFRFAFFDREEGTKKEAIFHDTKMSINSHIHEK